MPLKNKDVTPNSKSEMKSGECIAHGSLGKTPPKCRLRQDFTATLAVISAVKIGCSGHGNRSSEALSGGFYELFMLVIDDVVFLKRWASP